MRTYVCSLIVTLMSMFALIMLITNNKVLSKKIKTGLIISSALVMMCALAEFTGELFERGFLDSRALHIFAKYSELCLTPVVPIALTYTFPSVRTRKFALIPSAIHIALETLSLFFGMVFYVDETNNYHHGQFYAIYYFFIAFNIIYLVLETVKFGIKLQNRNHISLFMIICFILSGTILQASDSSVKIVWVTVAIGMILFYIYYCNMVYQVDSLTELLNRRAYDIHKSSVKKRAYFVVFDVNNFKDINDKFGHNVGDETLKSVASTIKEVYEKYGLCYRLGGDEFCVIIDRKTHSCDVEMLNKRFDDLLVKKSGAAETPLVAIGYALYRPQDGNISDVIKSADDQMYLNKQKQKSK